MRKTGIIGASVITCLLLYSVVSFSVQYISDFKIGFMVDKVYLKWKSTLEESVKEYVVERSFDNVSFSSIGAVKSKGNYSEYIFIDKNIFKIASRTFYYRLKITSEDGSSKFSKVLQISPRVSSAKQTWGSIKAIFH